MWDGDSGRREAILGLSPGVPTHVALAGVEDPLVAAEEDVADPAGRFEGVRAGGEGQRGPGVRARELHLRQVVDEEVELGGHAAQAGLDQPATRPPCAQRHRLRDLPAAAVSLTRVPYLVK